MPVSGVVWVRPSTRTTAPYLTPPELLTGVGDSSLIVPLTPLICAAGTEIVTSSPTFTADASVCAMSRLACHPPPVRRVITGSASPVARRLAIGPLGGSEDLGCGPGEAWACTAELLSPALLTVSPGWPSMATTVPLLGAMISVAASFIRSAARRARSFSS